MFVYIHRLAWLLVAMLSGVLLAQHLDIIPMPTKQSGTVGRSAPLASYADAVERVEVSVVNVFTPKEYKSFYRDFQSYRFENPLDKSATIGSGVILDNRGHIVTSYHVIDGADNILVGLHDGRIKDAEIVGVDPESDLAVLRIEAKNLIAIRYTDSDAVRNGDIVLAVGNPFGIGKTATMGIISATGRNDLGISVFESFIQTDAAINPGNSGGALVNIAGELIGINTAIFSRTGSFQGVGFAIPSNQVVKVTQNLIENGKVIRGWLGISIRTVTVENTDATEIIGLFPDGPADTAGLLPGDILLAVEGMTIGDSSSAQDVISSQQPDKRIRITVRREEEKLTFTAKIGQRPPPL